MAITYCAENAKLAEVAIAKEVTLGTFVTPTVQLPHRGVTWGRGHSPIDGSAATSFTQNVINHRAIRGLDTPFATVTIPYSANNESEVWEILMGGPLSGGSWSVIDAVPGWSLAVGANTEVWEFAGGRLQTASLTVSVGAVAEVSLAFVFHSLVDPKSASAFPSLSPTVTATPYVLKDGRLLDGAAVPAGSGTAIPFQGVTLNFNRNPIIVHSSSGTEPQCIAPGTLDITGTASFVLSVEQWADFESQIAAESDVGFTNRYLEFDFDDGTNEQRITLPVHYDVPTLTAPQGDGPITANLEFIAAADDITPTNAVIGVEDL